MPFHKRVSLGFFVAAGCALFSPTCLEAKPSGFHLRGGNALPPVQEESGAILIQSGEKALIDWEGFSISSEELVRFQQMDGNSYVLNRVVGNESSALLGQLQSNGSIYLINPNGIVIGPDARIETAGFLASTLDLLGEDLSEKGLHFRGDSEKGIVNRGTIHCPAGDIFLIARTVENSGTLITPAGRQGIVSGCDVWIRPEGSPEVKIRTDEPIDSEILLENPYALAIRHSGSSFGQEIYLIAEEGLSELSGSLVASKGEKGGVVHVLGDQVHLLGRAEIDVSGRGGGGEVLIGGDYQGKNPNIKNAKYVWAGSETQVKGDGLEKGDGGKVIFWSDEATFHYGSITIRGGKEGGNGGLAEVSGKKLDYQGWVDGRAPLGVAGMLLLDPNDVVIGTTATTGSFSACGPPSTYTITTATATNQILNTSLVTQLESCSVTISTVGSTGSGPNSGSITVSGAVIYDPSTNPWSEATTLTLTAASFISITAEIANTNPSTGFTAMNFTANGTSSGTNSGITLGSGGLLVSNGGAVILNGTASGSSSTAVRGVYFNGGKISTTTGSISVTGSVTGGSGASAGVLMATTSGMTSSSGTITISGSSSSTGGSSHGVSTTSGWAAGTSGLVTFSNCLAGTGSSSHGVALSGTFSTSGAVLFSNCIGGNNTSTGGNGINITAAFASTGSITATSSITGQGINGVGFASSANFTAVGTNSTIAITATGSSYAYGSNYGIYLSGGSLSTMGGGSITLNGISVSNSSLSADHGLYITGGASTISTTTGSGNIYLTGSATGYRIGSCGIYLAGSAADVITSTSGAITLSGSTTAAATNSHGVSIVNAWTPGTTGLITFLNCVGSSTVGPNNTGACHGVNLAGAFTGSGPVTFSNCQGCTSSSTTISNGSNGINVTAAFTTTGSVSGTSLLGGGVDALGGTPGGYGFFSNVNFSVTGTNSTLSITATGGAGTIGGGHGISLTGGTLSTTGGGAITLNGTGGATSESPAYGINVTGGASTISTVTGNGSISLTGVGGGAYAVNVGIYIAGSAPSVITSTSGSISFSGTASSYGNGSHGVSITSAWTPGTTGMITFSNCSGSTANYSHGVNLAASFTGNGPVTFSNCKASGSSSDGISVGAPFTTTGSVTATSSIYAQGTNGVGFASGSNFSVTGLNSGIAITAYATGAAVSCHGISLTGGTMSTTEGGSITLIGTGGPSTTAASHGINITGGATISTTLGSGNISLTGSASASGGASFGINLAAGTGGIESEFGTITLTGTSTATVGGSHGVSVGAAWTSATQGIITFLNCTGSNTGASHGVNLGAAFTGSGPVTFSNCTGGMGGSNGVNVGSPFTTTGSVSGTSITGNGNGGIGFAATSNFSTAGLINITASAAGTTGACHGISVNGATLSTTGSSSLTLIGTGGASSSPSHGINLTAGGVPATSLTTTSGNIFLNGSASGSSASYGIFVDNTTANTITSTSGNISLTGITSASATNSYGISVATPWSAGSSETLTLAGTGGSGTGSDGIYLGAALTNSGPLVLNGTAGAGGSCYANCLNGNLTTSGSSITLTGTTLLATSVLMDTTEGGTSPTGGNIFFSGSTTTIDGTAAGGQNLSLTGGTRGSITFGGAIGGGVELGALTINSASTSANGILIDNNITATAFTITTPSPVTLTGSSIINTSAMGGSSIIFPSTIDGTTLGGEALTLTADATGTVTLSGNLGSTIELGAVTISGGISGLSIGTAVTSIQAASFTVAPNVPTTLNNTAPLTINTSVFPGGSISFGGEILEASPSSHQALTLTANGTGSVSLEANVGATYLGPFSIGLGTGSFSIGAGVTQIQASSFTVVGSVPTTLNDTATTTINTSGANGAITFGGPIDGTSSYTEELTLNSGTGNIILTGEIGSTVPLGPILISNGTDVTANSITATSVTQNSGTGITTFNGPLNLTSNLSLSGTEFTFNAPILAADRVTVINSGLLSITAAGFMNLSGAFLQSGMGSVETAGTIFTSNEDITFNGNVTLTGNVNFNTGGSGGNIAFESTVDGTYGLNLNGNEIFFGAPLGTTPLTSLEATAGGTITVTGNQTVSTGPMVYHGNVVLMANTQFFYTGTRTLLFEVASGDAISGNYNLILKSPNGNVAVESDIDLSGNGSLAGGHLTATGGLGLTFEGQILTQGGDASSGTGGAGGVVSLTSSSGSISVHNINVSGGEGTTAEGNSGTIFIQPASGYSGGYPIGLIILNDDLSSGGEGNLVASGGVGGAITLSANRTSPSTVATIVSSLSGNDIVIQGASLIMGANEAMTGLGNITLVCSMADLGDLVALDNLTILSTNTNLLTHGDESLLDHEGLLYTSPTLHFLGGAGYVQEGTLTPSGPLNGQDVGLSAAEFRPLLEYNTHILNYDTGPRPTPPPPFVASESSKQFAIYELSISGAQLSDLLPFLIKNSR